MANITQKVQIDNSQIITRLMEIKKKKKLRTCKSKWNEYELAKEDKKAEKQII